MSAKILPFPLHKRMQQDFDRIFKAPGLGTVEMTPMDLGGHFVTVTPAEAAYRGYVTKLAEFRAKVAKDLQTEEQKRAYQNWGRNHPDKPDPEAA